MSDLMAGCSVVKVGDEFFLDPTAGTQRKNPRYERRTSFLFTAGAVRQMEREKEREGEEAAGRDRSDGPRD